MSRVSCTYNNDLSYSLFFDSQRDAFKATFKITCPDDFIYKPLNCYDGFLFAIILKAMEIGEDLEIEFPISKQGFQHATYFIEAWHNLLPKKYKKIRLIQQCPNHVTSVSVTHDECIAAFSGGVDASFTLVRHQEKDWGSSSYNLKNVLSVHGFDIPTYKKNEFDALIERVSPIFEQYGCRSFQVWTDLREKSDQDWEMSFAAQLSCCLHLFSEHFSTAVIASSKSYRDMFVPWGSTPSTDFLLSGAVMTVVNDGAGYSRTEKVQRIAANKMVSKYIKVCWQNKSMDNCGQCEKCYRTRLNFLAAGYPYVECFEGAIKLHKIPKMKVNSKTKAKEIQSILEYVKQHHFNSTWISLLKLVLMKWQLIYRPLTAWKSFSRMIRRKI